MTYANGTVSNVSSGAAFLAALDTALVATPGISKVETLLVSGTITWNVYKSAAANNAQGADFYMAFGYPTTGANSICATVFEGYNNGTHLATNYPPGVGSNTPVANFANPGPALALPSTGAMGYIQTANMAASFSYFLSATANRVVFGVTTTGQPGFYSGLYDSFLNSTDDPFPLCCQNLNLGPTAVAISTATGNSGVATREPKQTVSSSINFGTGTDSGAAWTRIVSSSDLYTGFPYVSRAPLLGRATNGFRGLLKDVYVSIPQTSNGDQLIFTLSAVNYQCSRVVGGTFGMYVLNV